MVKGQQRYLLFNASNAHLVAFLGAYGKIFFDSAMLKLQCSDAKEMWVEKKICRRVCQQKYMTIRLGLFRLSFSQFCERCAASPTKIGSARRKIPTPHFCHLFLLTYLGGKTRGNLNCTRKFTIVRVFDHLRGGGSAHLSLGN
jgi:hypothetical protein